MNDLASKMIKAVIDKWGNKDLALINSILNSQTDEKAACYGFTVTTLANLTGKHETTVRRRLKELKKLNAVVTFEFQNQPTRFWPKGALEALKRSS